MSNILENINEIKDKTKNVVDDVSTKLYRAGRKTKEKVDNAFNGKTKTDKEMKEQSDYQKQMRNQLMGYSEDEFNREYLIEEDGMILDANRSEFNVIDKDEYQEPTKVLTPAQEIESFLYSNEQETFFDVENSKKNKNKEYNLQKLEKGNQLKKEFLDDKFEFKAKNELLKNEKVKTSETSVERYGQLNHIVNAFAGNKEDLDILQADANSTLNKRFCEILISYMNKEKTLEETSNNLFLEIHGVNHKELKDTPTQEKAVLLSALSELGQDAAFFSDKTNAEIKEINNLVKNNSNINITELILKNSIEQIFEKTRNEGDQIKQLETDLNGGKVDALYFENEENGSIGVFHESAYQSKLVARLKENGEYEKPEMEQNLINAFKNDKGARDELEGHGRDGLDHEIETMNNITSREALEHPMSEREKAEWKAEQDKAWEDHQKLVNQYANS